MVAHRPCAEVRLPALARPAQATVRRRHRSTRLLLLVALLLALLPAGLRPDPALAVIGCEITRNGADGGVEIAVSLGSAGCPTITFASGVTEVTVPKYLTINRDVTIQGPGADKLTIRHTGASAIDGNVFYIKAGTVTLRGLTVAGGRTTASWGAGLSIAGSPNPVNVTLDGVTVTDNIATNAGGGGVYASNATLTVTDSIVSGNQALGGITESFGGGGVFLDDAYGSVAVTLTRSTVVGNTTPNNRGGGVRVWRHTADKTAILTLNESNIGNVVQPNTAFQGGGIDANDGTLLVSGSTISGNTTDNAGAGIYVDTGTTTITNSTIAGNKAGNSGGGLRIGTGATTIVGSTLSENQGFLGGGIFNYRGSLLVMNSTLSGNMSMGGGGLYAAGGSTTVRFATIVGNAAASSGASGGLAQDGSAPLTVLSSVVAGNRQGALTPSDCGGTITSVGHNLWGDQTACPNNSGQGDRNLMALNVPLSAVLNTTLADNGGPTKTYTLVAGSPAIDHGDNAACNVSQPNGAGGRDQRGVQRSDGNCDVGAVEYTAASPSPSPSASPSPSPSTGPAPSFADVPAEYWAHDQIVTFARRGITTGCGDDDRGQRLYCPERGVTRAEMATFLTRALGQDKQAPPATPTFADVPADYWAYGQIEAFVKLGITTGCGTDDLGRRVFCPDRGVTRAEMAAFLDRAKGQGELPAATPTFADVPPGYWAYGWIERFFTLKVTTGCDTDDAGNTFYCPDRGVTRAEMAVFIIRAYP